MPGSDRQARDGSPPEERHRQVRRRAGDLDEPSERVVELPYQKDSAGDGNSGDSQRDKDRGVALGEQSEADKDRRGPADEHDQQGRWQGVAPSLADKDPAEMREHADGGKGLCLEPLLGLGLG